MIAPFIETKKMNSTDINLKVANSATLCMFVKEVNLDRGHGKRVGKTGSCHNGQRAQGQDQGLNKNELDHPLGGEGSN